MSGFYIVTYVDAAWMLFAFLEERVFLGARPFLRWSIRIANKHPIGTSAAPNGDWIWVSVVASAVLRRQNTWWDSRRRTTPAVPDEGVARNKRRSQTRSLMQRDYYTTRNNVTPDSILPLCLYLELVPPISESSVASGVTKCTRAINYSFPLP